MKIALLSDEVINQIAAGEVIENPASVVKELVDNAIDAGAHSIDVEIQMGGQQKIKVEDDGCGMSRADLELCLLRHATSKIREVADLETLGTMGFRGEALAAIAAISKLQIRSSNDVAAVRLWAEGGSIQGIEPIARNRGTTIEVESLFYNAPARRKFQKTSQATSAQISRVVLSLAIAHPEIAFSLQSQRQKVLQVRASGWRERIEEVLGKDFCKEGLWFEGVVQGLLCAPQAAKMNRTGQYLFLNRRPIFSPLISKAMREGYGTRISEGSHPACILFLELPPGEFDVNVHPQKREVRFRNEGKLFCQVREAIQRAFHPTQKQSSIGFIPPEPCSFYLREEETILPPSFLQENFSQENPTDQALAVLGFFLLVKRKEKLFLVDLRICYEQTILEIREQQSLLWPLEIALSREESERLQEILQRCSEVGIDARSSGPRQICFDAIPKWLDLKEAVGFFDLIKEDLWRSLPPEETLRRFAKKSCKNIALDEAEFLWKKTPLSREISLEASDFERIFARKYVAH